MNRYLIAPAILLSAAFLCTAQEKSSPKTATPPATVRAFIDDAAPGWRSLVEADFAKVNSADDTWSWKNGVLYCTGQPISVLRTAKEFGNFEMVVPDSLRKRSGSVIFGIFRFGTFLDKSQCHIIEAHL